ncbi:LysM peptidoglycan-binding domain-containing protein [Aliikangiella coralliicola]|uniref:LysM peptidoglycan-binding domain-containing protein n=1 Tax=Aliikangiella coralliicola TaxID=2592383 RepID=A0A545UAU8_9GAMM|nr:LysM peptidoglycan-binding domain-containing protein [Aliikangiella coralliicola]TQV86589.1 LysM peptidoglycan-binding domain-containing protein [Aliikangiella coralliicola]
MKLKLLLLLPVVTLIGCKTLITGSSDPALNLVSNNQSAAAQLAMQKQRQLEEEKTLLSAKCDSEITEIDPTSFDDTWDRIAQQLTFEIPDNRRVRAQKSWYLKHPEYMKRVTKRAAPYLHYIVEEIEKSDLPLEMALLPIVESAFDPFAYSHGRASGMWQFIPGTGRNFGLKQNWWYDGRRDVYLSTKAAIRFLSYLNKRFDGDWLHALAAYNSGEGNVRKAIRRNKKSGKPTNFWALKLPKETKAYVPKLLALADILANRKPDDEQWTRVANLPYFDRVKTESQIDLSLAAAMAEISMTDLYQLNPAFNQWATAPKGPHYLLFPINKVDTFKRNLATIPKEQRISYKKYQIKPGDSLISIAKKFGTTVALLRDNNNIRKNTIRAGKSLLIPVASEARDKYHQSASQRLLARQSRQRKGNKLTVKVKRGDSMWDLSRKYKVNIRSLAKWNNMAPTDPLKIGQKLVVWTKQPVKVAGLSAGTNKTKKIYYKVRRGDSLARIADKFNVNLNSVKKWNKKMGKKKYLQPGDSLTLYVDITRQY